MKKVLVPVLILLLMGSLGGAAARRNAGPASPMACTSFAVYLDRPIYGMNFDYPEVPLRFTIQDFGGLQVFQMEFQDQDGFVPTVGMNSAGLFSSSQMLFPEMPPTPGSAGNQMTIWQLYQAGLHDHHSVAEVLSLVDEYQITNSSLTLHDLFADPSGAAVVVEVIDGEEALTSLSGRYIVMTNFPVSGIGDTPLDQIKGVGADRYQTASRIIQENLGGFTVDTALQILEESAMEDEYATQASMVFDPLNQQVYIALDRDYDRVWLASLREGTIETFRGFPEQEVVQLGPQGITEGKMRGMGTSREVGQVIFPDSLLAISTLSLFVLLVWYFRKASGVKKRRETKDQNG